MEFIVRYEPESLPVDGMQRTSIHFRVTDDRERLLKAGARRAAQFDMAASLRAWIEAKIGEDSEQILAGKGP